VALRALAVDILRRVRLVLRCFAVAGALLRLTKKSIGFLLHHTHWVRSSPLRVFGPQEFLEGAFDQTVLGLRWLVVVVGLAGLVVVVAAAHLEGEHPAWIASVARHFAVHCSVPASELVIPSPWSRQGAPHLGD
jgi:hypothetical protein